MRYTLNVDKRIKTPDDVASKMWDLPVYVTFEGDVTEESAVKFRENLKSAENAALKVDQKVLPVSIDTFGGDCYACLGMIDAMNACSVPIATVVEGKAMSAGAFLFSCGKDGHRYIGPSATIMIHTVALGKHGKIDEFRSSANEGDRLNDKLLRMMSKNCGHHEDYYKDRLKENDMADWYLDANAAVKHNLANKVHLPAFTVNVSMDFDFK